MTLTPEDIAVYKSLSGTIPETETSRTFLIILVWVTISALYLCIYYMGAKELKTQKGKNALALSTVLIWIAETGLCIYYAGM